MSNFEAYFTGIEKQLLVNFHQAFDSRDIKAMKEISTFMENFSNSCVLSFVDRHSFLTDTHNLRLVSR